MGAFQSLSEQTHTRPKPDLSKRDEQLANYARWIGLEGEDKMFIGRTRAGLGEFILGKTWPITGTTPKKDRKIGSGAWQDHAFALWKSIPGNEKHSKKEWGEAFKKVYPEYSQAVHGHDDGIVGTAVDFLGDTFRNIAESTGAPTALESAGEGIAGALGASEQTQETVGGAMAMLPGMFMDIVGPGKFAKLATVGKGGKAVTGAKSWVPPVAPAGKAKRLTPFTNRQSIGTGSTLGATGLSPFQARLASQLGTGTMMGMRTYSDTHSPFTSIAMGGAGGTIPSMMNVGGNIAKRLFPQKALTDLTKASTLGVAQRQLLAEQLGSKTMANTLGSKWGEWGGRQLGAFGGFELAGEGGALLDKGWKRYVTESPWAQGGDALKQHLIANAVLQIPFMVMDPPPLRSAGREKIEQGEHFEHHAFNKAAELKNVIDLAKPYPRLEAQYTRPIGLKHTEDMATGKIITVPEEATFGVNSFGIAGMKKFYPTELDKGVREHIQKGVLNELRERSKQLELAFKEGKMLDPETGEPDVRLLQQRQIQLTGNAIQVVSRARNRPIEELNLTLFGDLLMEPVPKTAGEGKEKHETNLRLMSEFKNQDPDSILAAHEQISRANELLAQLNLPPLSDGAIKSSLEAHEAQGSDVKQGVKRTIQAHKNRADELSKQDEFPTDNVTYRPEDPDGPEFQNRGLIMEEGIIDGLELDVFPSRQKDMRGITDPEAISNPQRMKGSYEVLSIMDAMESAQQLGYKYQILFRQREKGQAPVVMAFTKQDPGLAWLEQPVYVGDLRQRAVYEDGPGRSEVMGDLRSPFLGTIKSPYTSKAVDEKPSAETTVDANVGHEGDAPLRKAIVHYGEKVWLPSAVDKANADARQRAEGLDVVPMTKTQKSTQERYNELALEAEGQLLTPEQEAAYREGIRMVDDAINDVSPELPIIDTFIQQAQKEFINWFEAGRADGATSPAPPLKNLAFRLKQVTKRKGTGLEKIDMELQLNNSLEGTGRPAEFESKQDAEFHAQRAQEKHGENWQFAVIPKETEASGAHWRIRAVGKVQKETLFDPDGNETMRATRDLTDSKSLETEATFQAAMDKQAARFSAHREATPTGERLRAALMEAYGDGTPVSAFKLIEILEAYNHVAYYSGAGDRSQARDTGQEYFKEKTYAEINRILRTTGNQFKSKKGEKAPKVQMKEFFHGANKKHVDAALAKLLNENVITDLQYHRRSETGGKTDTPSKVAFPIDVRPGDKIGSQWVNSAGWVNRIDLMRAVNQMKLPAHEKTFLLRHIGREWGQDINAVELAKLMAGKESLYARTEIVDTPDGKVLQVIDSDQSGKGMWKLSETKVTEQNITNVKTGEDMGEALVLRGLRSDVLDSTERLDTAVAESGDTKATSVKQIIDQPELAGDRGVAVIATKETSISNLKKLDPSRPEQAWVLKNSDNLYLVHLPGEQAHLYYDHTINNKADLELYAMKAALNEAQAQGKKHVVVLDEAGMVKEHESLAPELLAGRETPEMFTTTGDQHGKLQLLTEGEGVPVKGEGITGLAYKVEAKPDSPMQLELFQRPASDNPNVKVVTTAEPLFEGLGDFFYRTGRRLGLRDAELSAHIEAGLNIVKLYPQLLKGMTHGQIMGEAHGAWSEGRNAIFTNVESRTEAGSPTLARFTVGHEMFHAWFSAFKRGKLNSQETTVINNLVKALTDVAPEQNKLVIQEALQLVPKEFRADIQKDIDASQDPYSNIEETMAHLGGVLSLAVTTPKSRNGIKDFLTFMPSQISDGVRAMIRFMKDGVSLFREFGRWASKGLVRSDALDPTLKSAMEDLHSQMKSMSRVENELAKAEQQLLEMSTLDPAGVKEFLRQASINPEAMKFKPDPNAPDEVNDMIFQMRKPMGLNPTDSLYKPSKADIKRLRKMAGETSKGRHLLRKFSEYFEPADQIAARRPHLAGLIGLMAQVSSTAKESIASIHSAGLKMHKGTPFGKDSEFIDVQDFKHMKPVIQGKGKAFELFNEIARWQQGPGQMQVWHRMTEMPTGEASFLKDRLLKLNKRDQVAVMSALEGITQMKAYETAIQTQAKVAIRQAWIADELMGLLNNSRDTLHPNEAFDLARDVWNLAMIQSTPPKDMSMNQMQQAQQLQTHLLNRLAPQRKEGQEGLSEFDRYSFDQIMSSASQAAMRHREFLMNKATSPGHLSEIRYGKYAYRFTKNGRTGMVAGRTKRETELALARATKGKPDTVERYQTREKDFAEISDRVMQLVSEQDIKNKQQLAAHLESITMDGGPASGLTARDLVGDLDAFFDAGHQLRKERLAREVALPGIKRGFALGREQINMWQNQLDHFNASTKNAAMSIMNARESVHLKDPNVVADPVHMKQVQTMLDNFRRPDTKPGTNIVKAIFTYFLGWNTSSHALEGMQSMFSITPNLTAMGAGVVGGNKLVADAAARVMKYHLPRGAKGAALRIATLNQRKLKPESGTYGDAEADAAMAYFHKMQMVDNLGAAQEVVDGQTTIDARQLNTPEALTPKKIALNTLKFPISAFHGTGVRLYKVTTNFNARVALLAGFNHFRAQKLQGEQRKLTKGELQEVYDQTAKFNLLVNFSGGKATRPAGFFSGKGDGGRTAAQTLYALQSYTAGMTATYGRFIEAAFKGKEARPDLTPRQRADHRKAVAQLFTTQLLAAGAVGLPFVGQMMAILAQMGWDVKKTMREELGGIAQALLDDDERASVVTDMAMHGVLSELLPVDMGSRFSLGGVMGVSSYEGATLGGALGPVGKLAEDMGTAASELIKSAKEPDSLGARYGGLQGRGMRAIQNVVPQSMKNTIKLIRNRGDINSDYNSLYFEDQTMWETIGQASGFVPSRVAHNRRYDSMIRSAKKSAMDSDQQFVRQVGELYKDGRISEVRALIRERAVREPGYTVESGASAVARYIEKNTIGQDLRLESDRRTAGAMNRLLSLQRHLPESSQFHRYATRKRVERLLGLPDQGSLESRGMNQALMMDLLGDNYPQLQKSQTQWRVKSEFPNP